MTDLHTPAADDVTAPRAHQETVPFGGLLRAEWRKSLDTRSAQWLLVAVAMTTIGAAMVPAALPGELRQTWQGYLAFTGLGLCLLLPAVSILALTTEWTQRTVLATYTQEPRRARVLTAKVLAGLLLGLAGTAYAALTATGALALSAGLGRDVAWDLDASHTAGLLLFVLLNTLMGMAFGALLHATAAAIVLFYALPTAWSLLAVAALADLREWLDPTQTLSWVLAADWHDHTAQILVGCTVWVLAPLALGMVRTARRDAA